MPEDAFYVDAVARRSGRVIQADTVLISESAKGATSSIMMPPVDLVTVAGGVVGEAFVCLEEDPTCQHPKSQCVEQDNESLRSGGSRMCG